MIFLFLHYTNTSNPNDCFRYYFNIVYESRADIREDTPPEKRGERF